MTNMQPSKNFGPKDFFLWLAAMAALYVSVVSFITLLFQYVNVLFPDELVRYYDPYSASIRTAIASLFVIFPIYIGLTRMLNQTLRKDPGKREYAVRKWLIFITLFVSGVSIVVDLVVLLNTFLGGDITTRFILKVVAILIVAGSVFGYYLFDLRGKWEKEPRSAVRIGWGAAVVVFATVFAGFFVIGSPATARDLRFDGEKVSDLQEIQWRIVSHWQSKETLPATLDDIADPLSDFSVPVDPQTNTPYEYTVLADLSFELCATFNRESTQAVPSVTKPAAVGAGVSENWAHTAGRVCFERTIDPELYPPYPDEKIVR